MSFLSFTLTFHQMVGMELWEWEGKEQEEKTGEGRREHESGLPAEP